MEKMQVAGAKSPQIGRINSKINPCRTTMAKNMIGGHTLEGITKQKKSERKVVACV